MSPAVELCAATWRYPSQSQPSLGPVDLTLGPGELVLMCGATGSGKSTLLLLASGLAEKHGQGEAGGRVTVFGRAPAGLSPAERAQTLAFVGQEPRDQLLAGSVGDELAFAAGAAGKSIESAELFAVMSRAGLDLPLDRPVRVLSGGQCQRLVVAAGLAAGARLILLDEPLAWLDPEGAAALVDVLRRLADDGVTVLVVEHRAELVLGVADRVVLLDQGRIVADTSAAEVDFVLLDRLGVEHHTRPAPASPAPLPASSPLLARWEALHAAWPGGPEVLSGVSLELRRGERVAIRGPNGAGKSTLLACISGRLGPRRSGGPRLVAVPQDADLSLFCRRVRDELEYGPREFGLRGQALRERVQEAASVMGIEALLDRPPQALSRGQRLRVAVAAALTSRPELLVLDEPSAGQDRGQIERMFGSIPPEVAVVFATHDTRLAAAFAHRELHLHAGRVAAPAAAEPIVPSGPTIHPVSRRVLDPRTRLGLLGAAGVAAVVLERPASLLTLCALCILAVLALRPGWRRLFQGALAATALIWSTTLSQALFYPEEPRVALLSLGGVSLWREGVIHGLLQSSRFVALTLAGLAVALATPPDQMLSALLALRFPYSLAFLSATGLRFVPVIAEEWMVVRHARAHRGRPVWRRGVFAWIQLELDLIRPVVARSLRRARMLARSLDARGFDPVRPPPLRSPLKLGGWDVALLVPALAATLTAVSLRLLFAAYVGEVVWFPSLRPVYAWVRAWL